MKPCKLEPISQDDMFWLKLDRILNQPHTQQKVASQIDLNGAKNNSVACKVKRASRLMVRLHLPEALQYKPAIPTILRSASARKSRRIKRIKAQRADWRRNKEAMMRGDWMEISRLAKSKSLILRQA